MQSKLLIATNNPYKVLELRQMLSGSPITLSSLADFPDMDEVEEIGTTFAQNSVLKACEYARATGLPALADDSGLEVEALGGRPGVYSARYGGDDLDFGGKMSMLLSELEETGDSSRRARFVCAVALAETGENLIAQTEGVCEGRIAAEPLGANGFGYDPIFIPDGFDETFGELPDTVKQKISHRSNAILQIIPFLRHFAVN